MKTFFKRLCLLAVFLMGLAAILLLSSKIVEPKNNTREAGILDPRAAGMLSESENTIDVLFVGDSETYNSFIPLKIWKDAGITSYCCGTSGQRLYYTREWVEKAFERQAPKVVVLETNAIYRDIPYSGQVWSWLENRLPLFRYHSRWKYLAPEDWRMKVSYTAHVRDKGYIYLTDVRPPEKPHRMEPTDRAKHVDSSSVRILRDIDQLCSDHGTKLVLISTPSVSNWDMAKHNGVQAVAESLHCDYLDLNLMEEEIPIDWTTETRDRGDHLNHDGALKVSAYMSKLLADTYHLPDHRGDERFAIWDQDLQDAMEDGMEL